MKSVFTFVLSACIMTAPVYAQQAAQPTHKNVKKTSARKKSAVPPPEPVTTPPPPPPPATLEQEPTIQPEVVFNRGQLTITAPNSTLGDILRAVRSRTGASVEIPANANERVVGKFGPGPARDVLASLLNGTHFNYVLLGSASDPNALDRVVLISGSGASPANEVNQASAAQPNQVPAPMPAGEVPHEPTMTDDEDPAPEPEQQQDMEQPNQDEGNQQPNPLAPPPGVKTPEQLLQELQRQQQQQQQQQGPPQGFPVPPGGQPQQ